MAMPSSPTTTTTAQDAFFTGQVGEDELPPSSVATPDHHLARDKRQRQDNQVHNTEPWMASTRRMRTTWARGTPRLTTSTLMATSSSPTTMTPCTRGPVHHQVVLVARLQSLRSGKVVVVLAVLTAMILAILADDVYHVVQYFPCLILIFMNFRR